MVSALAAGPEGGRLASTVAMDIRLHHQHYWHQTDMSLPGRTVIMLG